MEMGVYRHPVVYDYPFNTFCHGSRPVGKISYICLLEKNFRTNGMTVSLGMTLTKFRITRAQNINHTFVAITLP